MVSYWSLITGGGRGGTEPGTLGGDPLLSRASGSTGRTTHRHGELLVTNYREGGGVQNQGHWEEILFCLEPQGAQASPHTVMVSYWSLITGGGRGGTEPGTLGGDPLLSRTSGSAGCTTHHHGELLVTNYRGGGGVQNQGH